MSNYKLLRISAPNSSNAGNFWIMDNTGLEVRTWDNREEALDMAMAYLDNGQYAMEVVYIPSGISWRIKRSN